MATILLLSGSTRAAAAVPRAEHRGPTPFARIGFRSTGPWQVRDRPQGDAWLRGLTSGKELAAKSSCRFAGKQTFGPGAGQYDYFTHVWYRRMFELPHR